MYVCVHVCNTMCVCMYVCMYVYVIVITPLPGHYRVYTRNNIHNPKGVARGIVNIIECVSIMPVKACYNWFILREP